MTHSACIHTYFLAPVEVDIIRREFTESISAYGCLGVLKVIVGDETFQYLVLVTECQSVGKVSLSSVLLTSFPGTQEIEVLLHFLTLPGSEVMFERGVITVESSVKRTYS